MLYINYQGPDFNDLKILLNLINKKTDINKNDLKLLKISKNDIIFCVNLTVWQFSTYLFLSTKVHS